MPSTPFLRQFCAALFCATFASAAVAATPTYTVTPLDVQSLYRTSGARDLNNAGQVTGQAYLPDANGATYAFLYGNGITVNLGGLGGTNAMGNGYSPTDPQALNDAGQVVGASYAPGHVDPHAFLYGNGQMTDLGTLGGTFSLAYGINNAGDVIGLSATAGNQSTAAFLYSQGQMRDLATLGASFSDVTAINNLGQILGTAGGRAALFGQGVMTDLGTLGSSVSIPAALNDAGQATGYSYTADSFMHAFLYSGGQMIDLGTLGGSYSQGNDINAAGDIVGISLTGASSFGHGFLYTGGTMHDLNQLLATPGWTIGEALRINDNGTILAYGCSDQQGCMSVLLSVTSVPEPGSMALAAVGVVVLGARLRRRRA